MFTRKTLTVWTGIILLSALFLMGQEPAWAPSDVIYCEDMDRDGYGVRPALLCPYFLLIDCNDRNPAVHPGAIEAAFGDPVCDDGLDNDCDGLIDLDDNQCQECLLAADCDDGNPCTDDTCVGYVCSYAYNTKPCNDGEPCTTNDACTQGVCTGPPLDADQDGYVSEACGGTDCDDQNELVNPAATEGPVGDDTCMDTVDNDCDGLIDLDDDQCQECSLPADCNDGNPCTDDSCVGYVCSYAYNTDTCDDGNPCTTNDACSLGGCAGGPPPDADQDGYVSEACGGLDCDDQNELVNPAATEGPAGDGTCADTWDNDCNGLIDGADPGCGTP